MDIYGHLIRVLKADAAKKIDGLITPVEYYHLLQAAPEMHQEMAER
jgi:hypothetical protein